MLIKYNNSLLTHAHFYDGEDYTFTYLSQTPYNTILFSCVVSTPKHILFSFSTIFNNKVFITVVANKLSGGHYFSTYYDKIWDALNYKPLSLLPFINKINKYINNIN